MEFVFEFAYIFSAVNGVNHHK